MSGGQKRASRPRSRGKNTALAVADAGAAQPVVGSLEALLPAPVRARGITPAQWSTLRHSLYPGAKAESVLLVWDYCHARHLDPLRKPVYIVQQQVKVSPGVWEERDLVMPGVYEARITAMRTGLYMGHTKPAYGPSVDYMGVRAPRFCDFTVKRWSERANGPVEFTVRVHFAEVVAVENGRVNERWTRAPIQMLTKCAEVAALREAFPEELGGQMTFEEMVGQGPISGQPFVAPGRVSAKPAGFEETLEALRQVATSGEAALERFWSVQSEAFREHLTATAPEVWESIRATATGEGELTDPLSDEVVE